jgi:tRNA A58 N-methylase Trm61
MDNWSAQILNSHLQYCFGNEIEYLQELSALLPKDAQVLVIGAGPGIMSMALYQGNQSIILTAVDISEEVIATYYKHLYALPFKVNPMVLIRDSADAAKWFDDESLDLLVVDADHSYKAVKRDIYYWWSKLKFGGTAFFHDYIDLEQNNTNGVARAIGEMETDEWQEIDRPGISIVFRKVQHD